MLHVSLLTKIQKAKMKPNIVKTYPFTRECPLPSHKAGCTESCNLSVVTLEAVETPKYWSLSRKNVIFVVDISGSMLYTLPSIKASIKTFRDLMCGRERSSQPPVTDESFRELVPNFHLITFSDKARLCWSNSTMGDSDGSLKGFDDLVASLEVEGSTNMGEGIELAYSLCPQGGSSIIQGPDARASWIVVLTDGVSNLGKYQTADAFHSLSKRKPSNSKIISLGYGTEFDMETLDKLGDFTYLEDEESIPRFMGALTHEISTCRIMNVRIGFPQREGTDPKDIVFGSPNIGWFGNERKYHFGFIGRWGVSPRHYETGEVIHIHYTEIEEAGIWHFQTSERVSNPVGEPEQIPVYIRTEIVATKASKLIKELYKCGNFTCKNAIARTLAIVEKWTAEGEEEPRETVKRVCFQLQKSLDSGNQTFTPKSVQISNALVAQTSYTDPVYQTPSSKAATQKALDLSKTYL